ncbi:MAG: CDP-diacylglycerol--serine O-phosphatidyltransferase [Myxococcota bacterium]|nr:CDP-diacylglycerol--serine O-phosphatidyltransferase [Myxococcales bacterium]MBF93630.1 CDP-diacylglycerol--serine O-phosphatidyltransferase [Myxococcales bacterium]MEC7752339.1 CDP-diacylglycerol--serine O-phosphatidyltransferase [Myxococcota bacterium]HBU49159.1 CDP-diacylglycerol--serine O-phosphatidyltransferase [Myxococcales bacterium]|tara:strand:+ start:2319 stop:3116 length:798 start_codon:yes stop_codon:yes gene_type:complete
MARLRDIDLSKALFVLPNLFTMSSIACGFYAILKASSNEPTSRDFLTACLAIVFAAIFDTMDGRVARLTKTQSDFGVQLDSLADLVSFGVAPGVLVYRWALQDHGVLGFLFAFVFVAAGAARLARFNVLVARGQEATSDFVGLSIPLGALAVISLVGFCVRAEIDPASFHRLVTLYVVVVSFLMVSNLRMRSFKDFRVRGSALLGIAILSLIPAILAFFLREPYGVLLALSWLYIFYNSIRAVWRRVWTAAPELVAETEEVSAEI